jgi:hypothetical protein
MEKLATANEVDSTEKEKKVKLAQAQCVTIFSVPWDDHTSVAIFSSSQHLGYYRLTLCSLARAYYPNGFTPKHLPFSFGYLFFPFRQG